MINIIRKYYYDDCVIGELYIDNILECFTLEDIPRTFKIPGKTAIPAGTYDIELTYSPRFKCTLPLLKNVKGFEGIRIHAGNRAEDTEGCILVGAIKGAEVIYNSRVALSKLLGKMRGMIDIRVKIEDTKSPKGF